MNGHDHLKSFAHDFSTRRTLFWLHLNALTPPNLFVHALPHALYIHDQNILSLRAMNFPKILTLCVLILCVYSLYNLPAMSPEI
jgi:hypothetical protein